MLAALATTWVGGWTMVKLRAAQRACGPAARRDALEAGARGTVDLAPAHGHDGGLAARRGCSRAIAYALLAPLADCVHRAVVDRRARLSRAIVVATRGERRRRRGVEALSLDGRRALVLRRRLGARTLHALHRDDAPPRSPSLGRRPSCRSARALAIFMRLLAIQGSWNYENAARQRHWVLHRAGAAAAPGRDSHRARFKPALARESRYFNAHPYLASVAVGALARAELDGEPPERIERFRTALCGPLGSVGDRLVWAGWLPFCSLASLALFGLGAGTLAVVGILSAGCTTSATSGCASGGFEHGLDARAARRVGARAIRCLRRGPQQIGRLAALATGIAIPLALGRIIGPGRNLLGVVLVAVALGCARHRPPARVASKGGGSPSSCSPPSSSSR